MVKIMSESVENHVIEVHKEATGKQKKQSYTIMLEKKVVTTKVAKEKGYTSLIISYRVLDLDTKGKNQWHGEFRSHNDNATNIFSISSKDPGEVGTIYLDPKEIRGFKIGTYIMNLIISWAIQNYPESKLKNISLQQGQADVENKERRNRFYEQFGIKFNYKNNKKEEGLSCPIQINQLNTVKTWKKNIREKMIIDCLVDSIETINLQKNKISQLEKGIKRLLNRKKSIF